MNDDREDQSKLDTSRETMWGLALISQIGLRIAACILIGVLAGRYLDSLMHTTPAMLLFFSLLGAAASFKMIFDSLKGK